MTDTIDITKMPHVERDGKIAVVISTVFGDWEAWRDPKKDQRFRPEIVFAVEHNAEVDIDGFRYNDYDFDIVWIPRGARFRIEQYEGREHVVIQSDHAAFPYRT